VDVRDMTSPEQLMNHVHNIAQWVRLSGDDGEAKAFDYIEQRLKEWGIDYGRITHPAYISLPGEASLSVQAGDAFYDIGCITHAMAAAAPQPGTTAAVVDVGAGRAEDYRNFPAGAIALIDGLATPGNTLNAGRGGAAGAIYINGNELHEMIVSPVWGSPAADKTELLPKIPVVSILSKDAEPIREALAAGTKVQATILTEVLKEWRAIPLLTAEIPGNEFPDEVVLLSGHVDSWHYGAMDNGSANAAQLEALRVFNERRSELKRTFRVAFWSGHSHGRYAGSTWYVDHHWEELERRLAVEMYVDSIGGKGATVLSQAWAMSETKHIAVAALAEETGDVFEGGRFGRGGDQSFYGVGVSGLFMCLSEQPPVTDPGYIGSSNLLGGNGKTSGLGSWWHAVDDTPDKLDAAFLHRDARIYLYALARYLESSQLDLDFRPTVAELRGHLAAWQEQAGDRFSLERALDQCAKLADSVDAFYAACADDVACFNQVVMALGRALVPLNYSTGNRYNHDLALPYPPIPALQLIDELVGLEHGSDAENHLLVALQRNLNYVCDTLRQATQLVSARCEQGLQLVSK